jgi:hypothetical protein
MTRASPYSLCAEYRIAHTLTHAIAIVAVTTEFRHWRAIDILRAQRTTAQRTTAQRTTARRTTARDADDARAQFY